MRVHGIASYVIAALLLPLSPALCGAGGWPPTGLSICNVGVPAFLVLPAPALVPDGAGGAVILGNQSNSGVETCPVHAVSSEGAITPWPAPGAATPLAQKWAVSDGAGGVIAVWRDTVGTGAPRLRAARWLPDGTHPPGWSAPTVVVADIHAEASAVSLAADGGGGAFLAWVDDGTTDARLYVQHLLADGTTASGSGVEICSIPAIRAVGPVVLDGAGGAFVAWADGRDSGTNGRDVYLQRIDGALDPAWAADGVAVCALPFEQRAPALAADGAGGVYVAWEDDRADTGALPTLVPNFDVYLQRLGAAGTPVTGWPPNGAQVTASASNEGGVAALADGAGGVFLAWSQDDPAACPVFAVRIGPDALPVAGWTAGGQACGAPNGSLGAVWGLVSDHAGGMRAVWWEHSSSFDVRAQSFTAAGTRPAGWPPEGVVVVTTSPFTFPLREGVTDAGDGTLYVMWSTSTGGVTTRTYSRKLQHLGTDGLVAVTASFVSAHAQAGSIRLRWFVEGVDPGSVTLEREDASGSWLPLGALVPEAGGYLVYEDRDVVAGRTYGYRLAYLDGGRLEHTPPSRVLVPAETPLSLSAAGPNPANDRVTVAFSLPATAPNTRLELFDLAGRRWWDERAPFAAPGRHERTIPRAVPAGVYRVRLTHGSEFRTATVAVVR